MPVPYYGDFAEDDTVIIPFNTFDSNDPAASVTMTTLIDSDIKVHKDGGVTAIATDGATVVINFNSQTGAHQVTIDTSAHSDYATGSEYAVLIEGATVDGGNVTAWIGAFSIERAGGVLAILKAGTVKVDVETIKTQAVTCGAGVTVRADVGAAAAPGASNGMLIGGSNAATTFSALTVTNATTLTGAVSLGSTLGITGATTLASLVVSGTTALTGAVTAPAGITANITGNITGNLSGSVGTCAAATVSAIGANVITASSLKADACTKIIDDFETQSQADPTGFHVNIMEINSTDITGDGDGTAWGPS